MFVEEQPRQATPLLKQGDRFVVGLEMGGRGVWRMGHYNDVGRLQAWVRDPSQFGAGEIARRGMQLRPPAREVVYRSGQYSEGD